jgi:hypothetical protein
VKPTDLVFFVSCVSGRLCSRPGSPHAYIGARLTTAAERAEGAEPLVWDEAAVVPFSLAEFQLYERDLRGAVRRGDLVERTAEDFAAWGKVQVEREAKREAELAKAAKEAEAAAKKAEAEAKKAAEEAKKTGDKKPEGAQ